MQHDKSYPLRGGLDLVTPPLEVNPGRAIAGRNYECIERGYGRIDGLERTDGQPKASDASYWVLDYASGTAAITFGQTVAGATSGAVGVAIQDSYVSTGSFAGSDAAGYIVLTAVVGTFADGENLQVGGVTKAAADGLAVEEGATNDDDAAVWSSQAAEHARQLIQALPGSGVVRGVHSYQGDRYGFRDNAGGTAGAMYKQTAAGWALQSLGYRVRFTGGVGEIEEGQTVTGASSGAHGVATRVARRAGTWGIDAVGLITFASITGSFSNGENLQVTGVTKAVANGVSAANTLPAGGRYELANHNFYGASNLIRMYGCNGVGSAFDWDGSVFVPIETGMTVDTPNHLCIHKQQLHLAFPGGSSQNAGVGDPYAWTPILGASEITMGDEITGYVPDNSGVLTIFARQKTGTLYGDDPLNWQLVTLADKTGAVEWTAQLVGTAIYFDDRGIRSVATTQAYGNFKLGLMSRDIDPLLQAKKRKGVYPVASLVCRAKGQYRVFFSDGTGLSMYLGRKNPEIMPFDLGMVVRCCASVEDVDGNEIMLIGSDDGYVYELDSGPNIDGSEIDAYLRLPFNNVAGASRNVKFHKAILEVDASPETTLGMLAEYAYANPDQPAGRQRDFTIIGGGGYWNEDDWNSFFWSAAVSGRAKSELRGLGPNVSIAAVNRATYEAPHVLHGLTLFYSLRGQVKK